MVGFLGGEVGPIPSVLAGAGSRPLRSERGMVQARGAAGGPESAWIRSYRVVSISVSESELEPSSAGSILTPSSGSDEVESSLKCAVAIITKYKFGCRLFHW